ncbi:MAG: hypothetical protein ACRDS0_02435 [Pseudonocardiaceae bacterium]
MPLAVTVWRIVPRLAVPSRGAAPDDDPAQAHPVIATPASTTTAITISQRLVSIRRIAIAGFTTTPSADPARRWWPGIDERESATRT